MKEGDPNQTAENKQPPKQPPKQPQISQLVQFEIIEKEYEVSVPKFVEVEVERPVFVDKQYEVPKVKEVTYEKPIVDEKEMTKELTAYIKKAIEVAINEAIVNLKFSYEIPMPKVMKVERR